MATKLNIIVTGATRGLGLSISERLLSDGYQVIGVSRKISKEFEELQNKSKNIFYEQYDLSNLSGHHSFIKSIVEKYGPIYGLVNNAAVGTDGILATMHDSQILEMINVNLTSTILMTKYVARSMLLNKKGRIVNISSIIASTGFNGLSVYASTKSALIGFTKSMARELGPAGINVNAVSPGYMETDMTSSIKSDQLEKIKRRSPLSRLARTEDVAGTVSFLIGENSFSITGSNFTVDSGSTA